LAGEEGAVLLDDIVTDGRVRLIFRLPSGRAVAFLFARGAWHLAW
jgi:hypothetical protein